MLYMNQLFQRLMGVEACKQKERERETKNCSNNMRILASIGQKGRKGKKNLREFKKQKSLE
jgi:hypothetical protein